MRKILSEQEKEAKRKRNSLLISIFLLGILVLGTVGYSFLYSTDNSGTSDNPEIEEGVIRSFGNQWVVRLNGQDIYFTNSPDSVKEISVPVISTAQSFAGVPLYISSDSEAVYAEIGSTLGRFSSRVQKACYGPCEKDLPEKDCSENLIVWTDSIESRIYQEEKCIFIEGDMRTVDAFLYKVLGLSPNS